MSYAFLLPYVLTLLGPAQPTASTGKSDLPSFDEIVARYIEVTGGQKAYEAVHNVVIEAEVEIPAMGLEMTMTRTQAKPWKFHQIMHGKQKAWFAEIAGDGQTVWNRATFNPPRLVTDVEKQIMLRQFRFHEILNWKQLYTKVGVVGEEEVEGQACYKIALVPTDSPPEYRFFNKKTGLLVKAIASVPKHHGRVQLEVFFENYEPTEGIATPRLERRRQSVDETVYRITSVTYNVELPADRFAMPADVAALMSPAASPSDGTKPATSQPTTAPAE